MASINQLRRKEFKDLASKTPFNAIMLAKDYHITLLLYLMRNLEGIYFKGGTALQKTLLEHSRLSEDIDFTLTADLDETQRKVKSIIEESGFFGGITKDKDVEGFTRLVVHYKGFSDEDETVFIDLNSRAKLLLEPEKREVKHHYPNIPSFEFPTLAKEEMIAEKVAAAIGRNMPRDHLDIYYIIKAGIPINFDLVKKKCRDAEVEFDIIRMFKKAQKLKNRWDEDVIPLISEEIPFQEVMKTLAKHFKLKEEKEKRKNSEL